jgi:hypothetical protein
LWLVVVVALALMVTAAALEKSLVQFSLAARPIPLCSLFVDVPSCGLAAQDCNRDNTQRKRSRSTNCLEVHTGSECSDDYGKAG